MEELDDVLKSLGTAENVPETPPKNILQQFRQDEVELARAIAAARKSEGDRSFGNTVVTLSGWGVAVVFIVLFGITLRGLATQRQPQDKIYIATLRQDGSSDPAKPIEDQTSTERENTITQFMFSYVDYHESYDVAHVQRNYDRTRFTSAGEAQAQYVRYMKDMPNRPTEMLGAVGEKTVRDETVTRVGDNAFEVEYILKIKTKDGFYLPEETCRARLTYAVFKDMPTEVARRIDPLKLVVTTYSNHAASYVPKATICPVFPLS